MPRGIPLAIIALILLVTVAYANILGNQFTNWDDEHLIVKNKGVRAVDPLFLIGNFHIAYPPLTVFTHSLDHYFWGFNPVGYHLTDIALYALAVVAFFAICHTLLGNSWAGFLAAAIFALHPLHVESVAWLSSRKDGVGMLFYFLSFLAYLRGARGGQWRFIWLGALFYLCALWAKPFVITLPIAFLLYDFLIPRPRPTLARIVKTKLPYVIPLLITGLAAFCLDPRNEVRLPYHGGSAHITFLAMLKVMGDYLMMLMVPIRLSALYVVTLPSGIGDACCITSGFILLFLLLGAVMERNRRPLVTFCILWGFVSLLPVMQMVPTNIIKADRYLYLPSAAFCLFIGGWAASWRWSRWKLLPCAFVLGCLMLLTMARNAAWRDNFSLWGSVLALNPSNADAYNNLGIAYSRAAQYEEAERAIRKALELRSDFASAHNNLANVYRLTGRYDEAMKELGNAAGLARDIVYAASVYIGMGLIHEERGDYEKALEAYENASRLNPAYLDDSLIVKHREACREKVGGEKR